MSLCYFVEGKNSEWDLSLSGLSKNIYLQDDHCRLFQLHAESDNLRDDKPGVQGCLHQHRVPPGVLPEDPVERELRPVRECNKVGWTGV